MNAWIPPCKCLPEHLGIARRGPGFLHLLVRRYEADIVDQLSGAHREGEKVSAFAEPHLPALDGPIRYALMWHQASVRNRSRKHRIGCGEDVGPKLRMDTVGCDDHIGFRRSSVAERHSRLFA